MHPPSVIKFHFYSFCFSFFFFLLYAIAFWDTDLLLYSTRCIYSALHFAPHILRITISFPGKAFHLHYYYNLLLWSFIMSHDSLYGTVWRKAILFWNTKNSFYTNFKMFAIPQILTQAIQSFKKSSIKALRLEAEFYIPFAVMVQHSLVWLRVQLCTSST